MGVLGDRLEAVVVDAASPDRQITASTRSRASSIDVTFRPGAYRRYRDATLAAQLGELMLRLFERLKEEQRKVIDSVVEMPLHDDGEEFGPERAEYRRAVAAVVAEAADDERFIRISVRSLARWHFLIADRTTKRLTELEFLDALRVAVSRVLHSYRAQRFRIKDQVYGLGYPPELRRHLGLGPERGGAQR
jgi:hypothetical protein